MPSTPVATSLSPASSKAERTRQRLKDAVRDSLNDIGYRAMRIADVARRAGVAVGLFYRYFPDLKSAASEVLTEFMVEIEHGMHGLPATADRYDAIFQSTLVWVQAYERHPGLLRCLLQVAEDVPEFRDVWVQGNARHTEFLAQSVLRKVPDGMVNPLQAQLLSAALVAMVDGLLQEVYVQQSAFLRQQLPQAEDVAELLAVVWYRALYLRNPPMEKLRHAQFVSAVSYRDSP